jgi:hypothetical protein
LNCPTANFPKKQKTKKQRELTISHPLPLHISLLNFDALRFDLSSKSHIPLSELRIDTFFDRREDCFASP